MFCFTYADILAHMRADIIAGIIAGEFEGIQINQEMLLASSILMLIPILMIFLSLALKPKANRWTNIIVGAVYVAINLITMLTTGEHGSIIMFFQLLKLYFQH